MTSRSILTSMMLRRRQQPSQMRIIGKSVMVKNHSYSLSPPMVSTVFQHDRRCSFHGTSILSDIQSDDNDNDNEHKLSNSSIASSSWKGPNTIGSMTMRRQMMNSSLLVAHPQQQQQSSASSLFSSLQQQRQQLRWKHAAKVGKQRETLDEIAHRPEREAAQVRRQKKKDRQAAKKNKKGKGHHEDDNDDNSHQVMEDHDDDDDDEHDDDGSDHDDGDDDDEVTSLPIPSDVKEKMMEFVSKFQEALKSMQGTDPTPELFEDIQVDAYGEMTPIKAVGQVVIVSPTMAQITCFDPSVTKSVQKAIQLALQLNPQLGGDGNDGVIQIPIPRVSMETRQETAKLIQKRAESCRQKIRNIRRKQMSIVKQGKDGKIPGISEDEAFTNSKDLEKVTQDVLKIIQDNVDAKLDTILKVSNK